jgi:hypothetical protein
MIMIEHGCTLSITWTPTCPRCFGGVIIWWGNYGVLGPKIAKLELQRPDFEAFKQFFVVRLSKHAHVNFVQGQTSAWGVWLLCYSSLKTPCLGHPPPMWRPREGHLKLKFRVFILMACCLIYKHEIDPYRSTLWVRQTAKSEKHLFYSVNFTKPWIHAFELLVDIE